MYCNVNIISHTYLGGTIVMGSSTLLTMMYVHMYTYIHSYMHTGVWIYYKYTCIYLHTVPKVIFVPQYFHELFWVHLVLFVKYYSGNWWFLLFLVIALVTHEDININIGLLTHSWKYNGVKITARTVLYYSYCYALT